MKGGRDKPDETAQENERLRAKLDEAERALEAIVTGRKLAEAAVRESEERMGFALDISSTGYWELDLDGHTAVRTPVHDLIFGYSEMLPKWTYEMFLDHVVPEDRERVDRLFRTAVETRGDWRFQCRICRKDGETRWIWAAGRHRPIAEDRPPVMAGIVQDITARMETEQKHSAMILAATDGMWIHDMAGDIVEVNDAYCRMSGYGRRELLGMNIATLEAREAPPEIAEHMHRIVEHGGHDRFESRHRRKDGTFFDVDVTATYLPIGDGRVMMSVRDNTERKRAEDSLAETRDYLESLINYANAPIIVWSPDSRITRFNDAFEKLSGYKAEEVIGRGLELLFPEDSKERSLREIERIATGGHWETIEIPILRKDGTKRIALWNSANIYDKDGRTVISTIAQGQDITERKAAEEQVRALAKAIQAEKDRLSALVNSITDEIWFADADGRFTLANPPALRGFGEDAASGKDVAEMATGLAVLRPDGTPRPVEEAPPLRALKGETVAAQEETIRMPGSGELRHRQVSSAPVRDAAGNIIGSVSVVRDISDRKKAEQALQKARERNSQQEKLAAIGRLAGGVAHELRNPLAAMKNASYYLNMTMDRSDPLVAEALAVIDREIARSDTVISSLLGLARPAQPARGDVDVSALLRAVLEGQPRAAGISLEARIDEALPPVAADPAQLSIAFGNIIRNAYEAMPGGGRLSVSSYLEDGMVVVDVADSGVGIPSEMLGRLFEPLYTTKPGGTGLGLSVAKMLVDGSGGHIEVHSEVGRGSVFTVRLPARRREGR